MGITFRESAAEVELGLVSSDQLPDIAASGLLEGYQSASLGELAGYLGERIDPVDAERLWNAALQELEISLEGPVAAGRLLVRGYARMVVEGELPPQLGASKIAGVHRLVQHPGCDARAEGDCIDAAGVLRLFFTQHSRGYGNQRHAGEIDTLLVEECRRLAEAPLDQPSR